ncbi:MAG: flagellar hook-basal body complex protein [Desulfurivibrionaceae bacterium]|nr:flagellar hook-basal body complex protein [Desulfurivibrionaceae bacterium]
MSISSSLYSSISGLSTMGNAMSVLGDNVANVNTVAYKSSRATFQDVLSQSVSTASGSRQVGRGVTLSTVDGLFAQGSFESSSTPTDMAIGGQGFFMLRGADSTEGDMYTRAGEFRFDLEGNLVNPMGYFAQGWTLDSGGDRSGTIGDLNIGKSTPPITTTNVEVIANLDSRITEETSEERLFESWNGTNAALATPTPPIDSNKFEYTSAIKVYDSQGASHDVTVYFDKTTTNNEWEFMVTTDPTEDLRNLSENEQQKFAPDEKMDYTVHRGAGALMYGTIQFTTSGEIDKMDAWRIPPDGQVDPARNDNRIVLDTDDSYFEFPANFTGEDIDYTANPPVINPTMRLNLGARYSGVTSTQPQILVSDGGALSDPQTGEVVSATTLWSSVYDSNNNNMLDGDTFEFAGYDHDGAPVDFTYTVVDTERVQDLLDELSAEFGVNAEIDAKGGLRLTDSVAGDSALAVTGFTTTSDALPFGANIDITTAKTQIFSTGRALSSPSGDIPAISAQTPWTSVHDESVGGLPVAIGEEITFDGTMGDGTNITEIFTAVAQGTPQDWSGAAPVATGTVQDMLDFLEFNFQAEARIDPAGRLQLTDWLADSSSYTSALTMDSITYSSTTPAPWGTGTFDIHTADVGTEDGSQMGDTVSNKFESEALSTTQYANSSTTIFQDQDGYASGFLQSVSVDTEGVVTGHYSNGQVIEKVQVALASFNNPTGLFKNGGNIFTETTTSGAPTTGAPGDNGLGSIAPNALEQSNVDLGVEFVKLITVQRGFQANSKIITTTDEMLNDLINIKR